MLSIGIKYSMRDHISGINYWASNEKLRYASYNVNENDVSASSGIILPSQAVNSTHKPYFRWNLISFISISVQVVSDDLIIHIDVYYAYFT